MGSLWGTWFPSFSLFEDAGGICRILGALSTWNGLSWSSGRDGRCPLVPTRCVTSELEGLMTWSQLCWP